MVCSEKCLKLLQFHQWRFYLQIVQLTVGAGWDVEAGDVEDDLLPVGGEDPPLTLITFLERLRVGA